MTNEQKPRPISSPLATVLGMLAAIGDGSPERDDSIPAGWECNGCGGQLGHHPSCKPPRSLKKVESTDLRARE